MTAYPQAVTVDNLTDIIDGNDNVPTVARDEASRIADAAYRRAGSRGDRHALEDDQTDCLIATDWTNWASDEFGRDSGDEVNHFGIGTLERGASQGRNATLFTNTVVIGERWLKTGDGRKTQMRQYVDEDYANADTGEMWIPDSAIEYICIVELTNELIHDAPTASDAM